MASTKKYCSYRSDGVKKEKYYSMIRTHHSTIDIENPDIGQIDGINRFLGDPLFFIEEAEKIASRFLMGRNLPHEWGIYLINGDKFDSEVHDARKLQAKWLPEYIKANVEHPSPVTAAEILGDMFKAREYLSKENYFGDSTA